MADRDGTVRKHFEMAVNDVIAFSAGALLVLSFSPRDLYFLAFLSPAILFALWQKDSTGNAIRHGLLYGYGLFGFGVYWIFFSFRYFAHLGSGLAITLTWLFITVLAVFPAILGGLYTLVRKPGLPVANLLLLPAGWTLLEWLRGWIFTGFPWLTLGYSQIDSPLSGLAPVSGVLGASYGCVLIAAALANLIVFRSRRTLAVAVVIPAVLLGVSQWLSQQQWTTASGAPLSVALLQGNVSQDRKWQAEQRLETEDLYMEMIESRLGKDILVLPETALPEFRSEARPLLDAIQQEAAAENTAVLVGIPIDDPETGKNYNGVIALGNASGTYLKHHLVPFGEYLPLRSLFPGLIRHINPGWSDFSAGPAAQAPLTVAGETAALTICYEDAYPHQALSTVRASGLLVNVSNDAWFGDSAAPYQHLQISRMLALTMGRPMLRASNTGVSAIIDHTGRILASTALFQKGITDGEVTPREGFTPYLRTGNIPVLLIACLAMAMVRLKGIKY